MNFYQILLSQKTGFNRNLTWYENLFAKFYNSAFGRLLAKFLKIKGNTVKFNQLVKNGNFDDTSRWNTNAGPTFTVSNNEATITSSAFNGGIYQNIDIPDGHKYYLCLWVKSTNNIRVLFDNAVVGSIDTYSQYTKLVRVATLSNAKVLSIYNRAEEGISNIFNVKNAIIFDLTAMGIDNLTTPTQVETWLSNNIGLLPYYDYTKGALISFKGTGLKTVGFNQWDEETEIGDINDSTGTNQNANDRLRSKNYIPVLGNKTYYAKGYMMVYFYDGNNQFISKTSNWVINTTFLTPQNCRFIKFKLATEYGTTYNNDICINISDTSRNGTYEPYTSSTLSLPISTLFPTGMKKAGSIYDEISDKAYTRVGSVDLGTLNWSYNNNEQAFVATISLMKRPPVAGTKPNIMSAIYETGNVFGSQADIANANDKTAYVQRTTNILSIKDALYGTDVNAFKQAMTDQNAKLYYELATPTSQDISIDLSYGIEWGGTEQLLPENTSTPTTSAILADMHYPDGDRTDQRFVYREIEKTNMRNNRALSIILGRNVNVPNPEEPLDILLKGE